MCFLCNLGVQCGFRLALMGRSLVLALLILGIVYLRIQVKMKVGCVRVRSFISVHVWFKIMLVIVHDHPSRLMRSCPIMRYLMIPGRLYWICRSNSRESINACSTAWSGRSGLKCQDDHASCRTTCTILDIDEQALTSRKSFSPG